MVPTRLAHFAKLWNRTIRKFDRDDPLNLIDPRSEANLFEFILTKLNVPATTAADAKAVFTAALIICLDIGIVSLTSPPGSLVGFPHPIVGFCAVIGILATTPFW